MEIDVKFFLLANAVILGIIVYTYTAGKKKRGSRPSKFNIRNSSSSVKSNGKDLAKADNRPIDMSRYRKRSRNQALNIMFNYLGNEYDAYQVLQVPAGASFQVVEDSFRKLSALEGDSEKKQLFYQAFEAIQRQG